MFELVVYAESGEEESRETVDWIRLVQYLDDMFKTSKDLEQLRTCQFVITGDRH